LQRLAGVVKIPIEVDIARYEVPTCLPKWQTRNEPVSGCAVQSLCCPCVANLCSGYNIMILVNTTDIRQRLPQFCKHQEERVMLCKVCCLIFEGGAQARKYRLESIGVQHGRTIRYIHHATTRSLIDATGLCCYICTRVWRDAVSHGFSRGPELRWQSNCSTSYVLQTFDRQTLSISCLELLVSYARKRRIIDDGPGPDEIIFWTKFILEPTKSGTQSAPSLRSIM
jgi:hypothetical protein